MTGQKGAIADIKSGLAAGFPIVLGYFPVAMAFGLLSRNIGISLADNCLFSIMVFAGASQFMALDLIKAGVAAVNIVLATFLLNLRHLMMSASLSVRLRNIRRSRLIFIAFGVTDETFSVSSLSGRKLSVPFLLTLHSVSYLSWVSGTFAGYLVGTALPVSVQSSLGIGLYAMFAALLVPELKKSRPVLLLSGVSAGIYALISLTGLLPSSWGLIVAMIVSSALGSVLVKNEGEADIKESRAHKVMGKTAIDKIDDVSTGEAEG